MAKQKVLNLGGTEYVIEALLGQGGAAHVFKVRSATDGGVYALKRIRKSVTKDNRNKRFEHEIDFGQAAKNDHVVKIHDRDEDTEYFYYTMDLYPKNLREVIAEQFDYATLLDYLSQLTEGVAYVHAQGIAHRDIKPENILVDDVGARLVLADFGIAHFKDAALTQKGDLLANRNYQAPEQMVVGSAQEVREPADIFALGLVAVEMFTKQNPRGVGQLRVRDAYPYLSDLDLVIERMMLQDPAQRIRIEAVRDMVALVRIQLEAKEAGIREMLEPLAEDGADEVEDIEGLLNRASKDVLSAAYIFERASRAELSRYNPNYHCEIGYALRADLFNICVQSQIFAKCKVKFENEAGGNWDASDAALVMSPLKAKLLKAFQALVNQYPIPEDSYWSGLAARATHYFMFCKDYHCKELLASIGEMVEATSVGSMRNNLMDAPIIWIANYVRDYLDTGFLDLDQEVLESVSFETKVTVEWQRAAWHGHAPADHGEELFDRPPYRDEVAQILDTFEAGRQVSVGARVDGRFSVHFRTRDEYRRFCDEARAVAAPFQIFSADVESILQTEVAVDDLVALVWEPSFDIVNTLAKVLGMRDITERPIASP